MLEKDFKKLCVLADDLIEIDGGNVYRVANSWLHIKKEHPALYPEYEEPTRFLSLRLLGYILVAFTDIFRSLWLRKNREVPDLCDTLIVSHLINSHQLTSLEDPYFGDLGNKLRSTVIFINHIGLKQKKNKSFNLNNKDKKILYLNISFFAEIKIQIGCFCDLVKILKTSGLLSERANRHFYLRAAVEAISPNTLKALRIRYQVDSILQSGSFSSLITTYEGHSYERLLYQAAKRINPCIVRFGYHHPAIFKLEHSSVRELSAEFNPDVILCTGIVGQKQIRQKMVSNWTNVEVFGTHKAEVIKHDPKNICLVLPEGFVDECEFLFKFALEIALLKPNIEFVFRVHPRLQKTSFCQDYCDQHSLPLNVSFSSQSFRGDIAQAKWAIYRGSTAIIEAARIGVAPIYAYCSDELHVDPLYELGEPVLRVNCPTTASTRIEKFIITEDIMKYCEDIYSDRNLEVLL